MVQEALQVQEGALLQQEQSAARRRTPAALCLLAALLAALLLLLTVGAAGSGDAPWMWLASRLRHLHAGGGACAAAPQQTVAAGAAGSCILVVGQPPPRCLFLADRQVPGNCSFDPARLACTFPEATHITLAAPPGCAAAAAAAAETAMRAAAAVVNGPQQQQQEHTQRGSGMPPPAMPRQQPRLIVHPSSPGSWGPPTAAAAGGGWQPGAVFHPADAGSCSGPAVAGAASLVGWARATGITRLVMCGDSTMRQFFQRVVNLARAEPVTVDAVSQRYAHYSLGWAAGEPDTLQDSLWFSQDGYPASLQSNSSAIAARLRAAHEGLVNRSAALPAGMASEELSVLLVMGTLKPHQEQNMAALVRDVPLDWGSTAIVLSLCYWHTTDEDTRVWPDWWELVKSLRAHARRVVVVTCPVPPALPNGSVLAARNADLRRLIARLAADEVRGSGSSTGGGKGAPLGELQLLDAAGMLANMPDSESRSPEDPHYQCGYFSTKEGKEGQVEIKVWDGIGLRFFDAIRADRGGTCRDAANFALWQGLVCLLAP